MTDHVCSMPQHGQPDAPHACCRPPSDNPSVSPPAGRDANHWRRAAYNTAHCLLGCALGDIAAMTLVPLWWPGVPMPVLMAIAIASGIATSIAWETIILRIREGMPWKAAIGAAVGMSLISMILMEVVMNAIDWLAMGGQRLHWHDPLYWLAWGPALVAGFLAALPYNYYMLRRHGRSCH